MYDLIIIGGGPAGYHAALKGAGEGLKIALISDQPPGGVCLHSGCIPSKTLLHSTKLSLDKAPFAIYGGANPVDFPVLRERVEKIISTLSSGIAHNLKQAGVDCFQAKAEIGGAEDRIFSVKAGNELVKGKKLLLATGSRERAVDISGADLSAVTTVSELLNSKHWPQSLLIIGGGGIGLEMATIFARCGTEVTVVEQKNDLASNFDSDMTRILRSALRKEGIAVHTGATVTSIHHDTVKFSTDLKEFTINAEKILPAMGRIPRSDIPGIDNLFVERDSSGAIIVSSSGETSEAGCYAAGDITGNPMLAHAAYYESDIIIESIIGTSTISETSPMPQVLYTTPELASVGLTEFEAKEAGISVIVKKRPLGINGRFLAETSGERGICKVVIDKVSGEVLGIHLAAPYASEIISLASMIVQQKLTAKGLASIIFPHPTIAEIVKQTIVEEI